MDIKNFIKKPNLKPKQSRPKEVRRHIRLDPDHCVKFTSSKMDLILKVAKFKDMSLSEFCKVAALKEARLEVMRFKKDKVEMAREILKEEEERKEVEERKEEEERKEG